MHSKTVREKSRLLLPLPVFNLRKKRIINIRLNNFKDISNIVRMRISIIENFKNNTKEKRNFIERREYLDSRSIKWNIKRMNIYSKRVKDIRYWK